MNVWGGIHAPTCSTLTQGVQGLLTTHMLVGRGGSPVYTESSSVGDGVIVCHGIHGIRNSLLHQGLSSSPQQTHSWVPGAGTQVSLSRTALCKVL